MKSEGCINIMIVDDSDSFRGTLERRFARNRYNGQTAYRTLCAASAREAMEMIAGGVGHVDAFLIDIRMETDHAGITLIDYIRRREQYRYSPIIVVTGQPGEYSENRIDREYLIHGYIDKSENTDIVEEVRKIIVQHRISRRTEHDRFRQEIERNMGSCARMQQLYEQVENCSRIANPVLYIDGETGTGKSLIAGYFHNISNNGGVFIDYNCSTPVGTDENILKSILFGSQKGFLSADHKGNEGLLKQAENGTLLLDEFQNVSAEVQSMLIKVIEDRQYRSLGSEQLCRCNVNILIAGNRDVKQLVKEKLLREDFYFRILDVLKVPPLRQRREDIPHFVNKFMEEANRRLHKYVSVSQDVLAMLEGYDWPGNVRQLKNVIERAVLHCRGYQLSPGDIRLEDVEPKGVKVQDEPVGGDFFAALESLIRQHAAVNDDMVRAKNPKERRTLIDFDHYRALLPRCIMEASGGNKKATAQLLGLTVEQLATLLKNGDK